MPRYYQNWIKAYVNYTRYSESPDSYHFWTGVATVAGALRRRVWIDQRHFQWTPNFYIILVGPPGVAAKSTSIRSGLNILEKVPGIFFGPQSMTWQALTDSLQNAQEHVEIPNLPEPEVMSCITVGISELGTFLRPDDNELMDVLIAMWDGQKEVWRRQTKTQGNTIIHNPWLNIIGCTTPAWLKQNFPNVLIGGGLTSRIVFVYADKKRQLVAYPGDFIPEKEYQLEQEKLLSDLMEISTLAGEYKFSKAAKDYGVEWYRKHWTEEQAMSSERFAGYVARKQTHLHKTAIVLAAAKRSELILEAEDLIEADAALSSVEIDMAKVFEYITVNSEDTKAQTEVLSLIKAYKKVTYKVLWQRCFSLMKTGDFVESIKAGIQAGHFQLAVEDGEKVLIYTEVKKDDPA